jgi:FeS assembly SUF system protein
MDVTLDDTLQDHLADIKPTNPVGTLAGSVARDVLPLNPPVSPTGSPIPAHLGSTPVIPGDAVSAIPAEELEQLTADIVGALKTVYDPEIPCDIYELGLIYKIDIDDNRAVTVDMTLTAPGCPVAGEMPIWVENAVNSVPGISGTKVNLTFDPPWDKGRMSDEARLALNMF